MPELCSLLYFPEIKMNRLKKHLNGLYVKLKLFGLIGMFNVHTNRSHWDIYFLTY